MPCIYWPYLLNFSELISSSLIWSLWLHQLLYFCCCCCCCQVASVVSDSMWPHRRQPTRLPRPWDSLGKNTRVGCHFLLQCMKVKSESEVAQSCPTLSDLMDCSLPGSSIHGIFHARVLEWVAISFSSAWKRKVKVESLSRVQFKNHLVCCQFYAILV